jgi:hypothetical protein
MITLVAGLLSVIFALVAVLAHLFEKSGSTTTTTQNQAVVNQVNANDAQIQVNQAAIDAEKTTVKQKEQGETNDSILSGLNNPPK